jgi:hypothetical protein
MPVLLTACKGVQALGTPPPAPPDIVTLRGAISAEQVLVARYTTAIRDVTGQFPPHASAADLAVAGCLRDVLAEHQQHLTQLRARLIEPAGGVKPSPAPSPAAVTGSTSAVLGQLEQAEQAASDRLIGQVAAVPPALAQLFASIAASEATHVPFLRAARSGR